ncbi:FtsX-like permease family protein [Arthrobacter sp. NPDC080031]|uniref:FtsX-like permease family protein n=1 Tax=Arthrobacter sp. NPDC080031 TaxID=3155918 RepID=UPI00344E6E45
MLKLAVVGSRSSYGRLMGIMGGVAVGVCLLLLLWGGANGLNHRDERGAWLRETGGSSMATPVAAEGGGATEPVTPAPLTSNTALMRANPVEVFRDQLINRRDFAVSPTTTVKLPGVEHAPGPGEYYASPALQRLIEATPRNQLGDRFGQFVGFIDDSALPGPDSLIVITGATETELRQSGAATLVSGFTSNPYGENASAYMTVLLIGAIAVFFPVLLLIRIATALGAAERRERFATLRLIGASPQVVSWIAAIETAIPSLAGAMLGIVLAVFLTPAAAQVSVNGTRMFEGDLATKGAMAAVVVILVVVAATLVAGYSTARAGIGPLGAARMVHEKAPGKRRLVPLLAGLLAMIMEVVITRTGKFRTPWLEMPLLVGGFALILIGIVIVGPWLTLHASRLGLHFARSASAVIAASRIRGTPVATFRSVAGLVVAVFVVSVFAGASSIIQTEAGPAARPGLIQPTSLHATIGAGQARAEVAQVADRAKELPGIHSATIAYAHSAIAKGGGPDLYIQAGDAPALGFENIPQADVLSLDLSFLYPWTAQPLTLTPAPVDRLSALVPAVMVVGTDGTPEAMDRARTLLNGSGITAHPASSVMDTQLQSHTRLIQGLAVLAYLGMFVAIAIAGMSLAVATASAVLDRKRVLGLMRLMGMPVSVLRRITVREAAVPLVTVLFLSIGLGFFVAWLMVTGINDTYRVTWPAPDYFAALGLSLLLALVAVTATFRVIRAHTAISATRFE